MKIPISLSDFGFYKSFPILILKSNSDFEFHKLRGQYMSMTIEYNLDGKAVIRNGCWKTDNCGGDLIQYGGQLNDNKPDQFRCSKCGRLHIIYYDTV